jgi:hypothetical protein
MCLEGWHEGGRARGGEQLKKQNKKLVESEEGEESAAR